MRKYYSIYGVREVEASIVTRNIQIGRLKDILEWYYM